MASQYSSSNADAEPGQGHPSDEIDEIDGMERVNLGLRLESAGVAGASMSSAFVVSAAVAAAAVAANGTGSGSAGGGVLGEEWPAKSARSDSFERGRTKVLRTVVPSTLSISSTSAVAIVSLSSCVTLVLPTIVVCGHW